jgi:UDP-perosamine 4-acetyltransferase
VNGLGSVESTAKRAALFQRFKGKGYRFATVVHPSAVVAGDVVLEEGVQVMAGAVIQPGTRVGENTIVNTGAIVDHDCALASHVHVAPGAVLSGGVSIGEGTHVGTGAKIIQGVRVGSHSLVAAGAVVVDPVGERARVFGVPAREMGGGASA